MTITRYIATSLWVLLYTLTIAGCSSGSETEPTPPQSTRTVLVYMVANNNLSGFARADLDEMSAGMKSVSGRLLVYYAPPRTQPQLIEIMPDGSRKELCAFTDGLSSVDVPRMRDVISRVRQLAPADGYGLVLWSHGTGWIYDSGTILPDEPEQPSVAPQSFGWDGYPAKKMSIESLAEAIGDQWWDFIYFDCCHMATVEVAYALRRCTPAIVASATELGVEGMPYDQNLQPLFRPETDLRKAVNNTFSFYDSQYNLDGGYGCSISLLRTSALDELALLTRQIYSTFGAPSTDYIPVEYFRVAVMNTGIFDMYHHIRHLCTDDALFNRWAEAFRKVVELHHSTPTVYGLPSDDFHGLGSNVIFTPLGAEVYNYEATAWWTDVVSHSFTDPSL